MGTTSGYDRRRRADGVEQLKTTSGEFVHGQGTRRRAGVFDLDFNSWFFSERQPRALHGVLRKAGNLER